MIVKLNKVDYLLLLMYILMYIFVKMVSCHIMGGLGNNLFQVAATIGTAEKYNTTYSIPEWEHSPMFAGEFTTTTQELPRYHEPSFHYTEIPDHDIQLFGYFQSARYFEHCEQKIKKMFAPSDRVIEKIKWKYEPLLKKRNTCAVHVRRGDYLQLSEYHYNLETEYYTTIMNMFPDFHYVCFSDDIEWCNANIPAHDFISDSLAVDFHLMSMMDNIIMANSSFSWWAGRLNPNKDKMIFAPSPNKWFGEKKKNLCVTDLYCDNWLYSKC